MPQLHFSIDNDTAADLEERARQEGIPLSRYLARLVKSGMGGATWPDGYLDAVVGSCADAPLEEPPELPLDQVEL